MMKPIFGTIIESRTCGTQAIGPRGEYANIILVNGHSVKLTLIDVSL